MYQGVCEHVPLHLGRLILKEGVYGFFIRHVVRPGIMSTILEVAAKYNLTILHIMNSGPAEPGSLAPFIVFYDFSRATVSPEEVKETIERAVKNLVEVKIIRPTLKGLTYDQYHFPLIFADERAIIIRATTLKAWLLKIRDKFGTGGEAFLFHEGFEMGSTVFEDYAKRGLKGRELWDALIAYLFSCGLARNIDVRFEGSSVEVELLDSIECSLAKGRDRCFSQWLRGILSGFASKYFNKTMYFHELKCIAKGDTSCLFVTSI